MRRSAETARPAAPYCQPARPPRSSSARTAGCRNRKPGPSGSGRSSASACNSSIASSTWASGSPATSATGCGVTAPPRVAAAQAVRHAAPESGPKSSATGPPPGVGCAVASSNVPTGSGSGLAQARSSPGTPAASRSST
ncbi:hypothetical protein ACFQ0T_09710 [Kitasatospora gansuensis]